jgi:riboflavin synthase
MFTGIIRRVGAVESFASRRGGAMIVADIGALAKAAVPGDSFAINGACLTAASVSGTSAAFDAVRETLALTDLGGLKPGDMVNIEPAIRAGEPFGGHFVSGHVDGIGRVVSKKKAGSGTEMKVACAPELAAQMVHKGSVAVSGVSLTIVRLEKDSFTVELVPFTLSKTTLGGKRAGDRVNIEADMLGKYVRQVVLGAAAAGGGDGRKLSEDFFRSHGF